MKKRINLIILLSMFLSVNAYGQDDLSQFVDKKIVSLRTVSFSGITATDIEEECDVKEGATFSLPAIRSCLKSFHRKGFFKDIVVSGFLEVDGVAVQFNFVEKIRISNIVIKGHDYFTARRLRSVSGLRKGDELSEDHVIRAIDRLISLYGDAGFFDASIRTERVPTRIGQEEEIVIHIDEGKRVNVSEIILVGDRKLRDDDLRAQLKIRPGDYYSQKKINRSINSLEKYYVERGYLKVLISPPDLLYNETGEEVQITLSVEAGPLVEIQFEGVDEMDEGALKKQLLIWQEKAVDNAVLDESQDRLMEYYRKKGYYFVTIAYEKEDVDPEKLLLKFWVTEGPRVKIREIVFKGNSYFSSKDLKGYLTIKEKKFLLEEVLQEDVKNIATLYRNIGFLDVQISSEVIFDSADSSLDIHVSLEEGTQTVIGRIRIEENYSFNLQEIMKEIKSREGDPYSEFQVTDDIYSIQSLYVRSGYIYASVDSIRTFSPDRKEVDITFVIKEDKQVYIGDIYIRGNSFTRDHVIRRELLIKRDDVYSYENILRSQRRLLNLGFFRGVKLEPLNPEVKDYVKDMSLRVEEGYPGSLEFGIGYGDVERIRGMFEASYRNIFGTGRQISMRAEASSIEQKYNIGYKEPWVLGYQMDARFNLVDLIENKRSFDRRTIGLITGVDKSFTDYVKGSFMYQYEDVKLSDVSAEAILTPEDTGKVKVATINPSIIIDKRNDPFNPSAGAFYSIGLREAARVIGSAPQFAKVNLQASYYYSPVKRIVLGISVRSGIAWNFGESKEVPIFERYFAGGRSTVRGYEQERLGIPGKTIFFDGSSWNPTGGNLMAVLNWEIRFPLYKGLGLVTFLDSGSIWRKVDEFNAAEMRSAAGAGIRYDTPVGPLRLDVGCKLDREPGEDDCVTHFTLGHAF